MNPEKWRLAAGLAVLGVSVFMLVSGVRSGEAELVLRKAANVCLECIGIG